jgi:hypothetical protein
MDHCLILASLDLVLMELALMNWLLLLLSLRRLRLALRYPSASSLRYSPQTHPINSRQ